MAKILLIKASHITPDNSSVTPPLGLMYLAGFLRGYGGHECKIIDTRVQRLDMKEVSNFSPEIIGISSITAEVDSLHALAQMLKEALPDVKIITGGPHPSQFPTKVLSDTHIDFAVIGEGEMTFHDLVDAMCRHKDISVIKGLAYRDNGTVRFTQPREHMEDLDSLPFPAWDLIDPLVYAKHKRMSPLYGNTYMTLFTSRACPYHCIYCHNIFGKNFRASSPERVVKEIETLVYQYNIREFDVVDDIFNLDKRRAEKIFDLIVQRRLDVSLAFPNGLRSDRLDENILKKSREAGTEFISFAIETASPRLQRFIKKNLDLKKAGRAISIAARHGIYSNGFFILGFPTETQEEALQTIRFALESDLHSAYFFILIPFENTELFEKYGKDFSADASAYDYYVGSFNLSEMSDEVLFRLQKTAFRKFWLNPLRLLRMILAHPSKRSFLDIRSHRWLLRRILARGRN